MRVKIKNKKGITLQTAKKYCDENIEVYIDERLLEQDHSLEDSLIERTLSSYYNDRVSSVGDGAFIHFRSLKKVELPNVTIIGQSFSSLRDAEIILPKLEVIGTKGFDYCRFTQLAAPLKEIYAYGIIGNTTLQQLIITQDDVVCTLRNTNAFNDTTIATSETEGFVYVPDNLYDEYIITTNWTEFANKIKPISELPSEIREELGLWL